MGYTNTKEGKAAHIAACKKYNQKYPEKRKETCKRYNAAHRLEQQEYNKLRRRERLVVRGKSTKVNKRPYSETCELCGGTNKRRLDYHHWDDDNPSNGLWLCRRCHFFVEMFEQKGFLLPLYEGLKKLVEESKI